MTRPIISVEHLSKAYRLGRKEEIPDTFVGAMTGWIKAPVHNWRNLRRLNTFDEPVESTKCQVVSAEYQVNGETSSSIAEPAPRPQSSDTLWALRDVSFDVHDGEVVGIIGRNGAGKSTLLKILSRITEPTHGRAVIRGRVSSLLEVGTGFHPELTGRENVYMNGTILGMRRKEIDRKFDEIVAFSGVETFLDTPVKRYSSGMQVRLAFAVAAHLEPEILIIDEVLAVGDAEFQKKCLGKMQDVASGGRTVLFVSHNMAILQAICDRGMLMSGGTLIHAGPINESMDKYLVLLQRCGTKDVASRSDREGKGRMRLSRVSISMGDDSPPNILAMGRRARFEFELTDALPGFEMHFLICDQRGTVLSNLDTWIAAPCDAKSKDSEKTVLCDIDELPLRSGRYYVNVTVMHNREVQDRIEGAAWFDVENGEYRGRVFPYPNAPGLVCIDHRWIRPQHS